MKGQVGENSIVPRKYGGGGETELCLAHRVVLDV